MLYFAYGSNMLTRRLQARTPSAQPVSRASVQGWRLCFDKLSKTDGSGKCSIQRDPAGEIYGAVFNISENEIGALDDAEGVGGGYTREPIRVTLDDGSEVSAETYQAQDTHLQPGLRPYDWYLALVIAGAEEHRLPPDYIARLRRVACIPDSKANRPTRIQALSILARDACTSKDLEDRSAPLT